MIRKSVANVSFAIRIREEEDYLSEKKKKRFCLEENNCLFLCVKMVLVRVWWYTYRLDWGFFVEIG